MHYFQEKKVCELLARYQARGCTDIALRDEIMSHAEELINGLIKRSCFHLIHHMQDHTTIHELYQIGWLQIEKTLYKIDPDGPTRVYSAWTAIAGRSILAQIKNEKRDIRGHDKYAHHVQLKPRYSSRLLFKRVCDDLREAAPPELTYLIDEFEKLPEIIQNSGWMIQLARQFDDHNQALEDIKALLFWMRANRHLFELDDLNDTTESFQ